MSTSRVVQDQRFPRAGNPRLRMFVRMGALVVLAALLLVGVAELKHSLSAIGVSRAGGVSENTGAHIAGEGRDVTDGSPTADSRSLAADGNPVRIAQARSLVNVTPVPSFRSEADFANWMRAHSPEQPKYFKAKWERVQAIIARGDATDPRLIAALLLTPRELFVRAGSTSRAYADAAMPIGYGQTISGPHLVARMTQALDIEANQRVLEIGTGSGYQSALLSTLTPHVYTIEIVRPLAAETDAIYRDASADYPQFKNISRRNADGYYGWPQHSPFDRIIVTCGIDHVPPELLKELTLSGIMVIPIGPPTGQRVLKITKVVGADGTVTFRREDIYHGVKKVIFVPFLSSNATPADPPVR